MKKRGSSYKDKDNIKRQIETKIKAIIVCPKLVALSIYK